MRILIDNILRNNNCTARAQKLRKDVCTYVCMHKCDTEKCLCVCAYVRERKRDRKCLYVCTYVRERKRDQKMQRQRLRG